jgi:hypothetical protein
VKRRGNDERKKVDCHVDRKRNRLSIPMMKYRPSGTRTFGVNRQVEAV